MFKRKFDVIYLEGAGDIVSVLELWGKKSELLLETSITYSSQMYDFCYRNKLKTLAVSNYKEKKSFTINNITAKSIPKKEAKTSISYHLSQILYGIKLLIKCINNRPQYLHIPSGLTYFFILSPLKLFGIKIIPRFHNTLWPVGFYPKSKIRKLLLRLDAWFLTHIASSTICVSEAIKNQIIQITKAKSCPVHVFIPQFNKKSFNPTPPPTLNNGVPFNIVFAGRLEVNKGIFDILEMGKILKDENVNFDICGGGAELENFKSACIEFGLAKTITIHGPLKRNQLVKVYQKAHIVIIPTKSTFTEGYAKVAAEAILLNRPILTSSVVPSLEPLKPATLEATTDNIGSYVEQIRKVKNNPDLYHKLCESCIDLQEQFFDKNKGMSHIIEMTR